MDSAYAGFGERKNGRKKVILKSLTRKSIRLKGFDYSEAGEYFVTICTKNRMCTLGEIADGTMVLSLIGAVVENCWKEIPAHFEKTRVDVFRIMPNHVHGIVEIRERAARTPIPVHPVGVEYIQPLQGDPLIQPLRKSLGGVGRPKQHRYQHVIPKSLGSIIRSFKAAVTREVRREKAREDTKIWQRDFYDHIIRSDIDYFFIQRYIELNPFLWHLDTDNPQAQEIPIDELKRTLKETHGLDDSAITYLIDCEMNYRAWQEKSYPGNLRARLCGN